MPWTQICSQRTAPLTSAYVYAMHIMSYTIVQDDALQQGQIMMSLEAGAACLQVLAAAGMPKQVYKEELIDRLAGLVRFQLLHNVLVFHDAVLCQAQRPELLNPGVACLCICA